MKIVIISACAPPEPNVAGRVSWEIAQHLASMQNEVWLLSPFPSRPLGVKYEKQKKNKTTKISDRFFHVNINSFTYPKYNLISRTYESFHFGLKSIRFVNKRIKEYDLMYALPWPFVGQFILIVFRKNKKIPLVMNIQDLYPESFFAKLNSKCVKLLLKPLLQVDKYIANKSTHLTLVSNSIKQAYIDERKTSESKLSVIHNWQDESEFMCINIPEETIYEKYNIPSSKGKFNYMYLGNIGPVAGIDTIIRAYSQLNRNNSELIIAGGGSFKQRCILLTEELEIPNIHFVEVPLGLKAVVELQSIANVLLLPILPEAANSSIPSKLIAYMFSRKPIITSANSNSETGKAVKESRCGWITKSHTDIEWANTLKIAYNTDKRVLDSKGKSGFEYALLNYSKTEGLIQIKSLFDRLIAKN